MLKVHRFTFGPFQENTFLVHNGTNAWVVDPGCSNADEAHELEDHLTQNALTPVRCMLTHAHVDHVMGCAWIHERYGLRPWVHEADHEMLKNAPAMARLFGVHCTPPPEPEGKLLPGEPLLLGSAAIDVLFVPGHAPGHVAFHYPSGNWIIGGDVLFQGSVGRTDLPGGNMDTLLASIRSTLWPLPDVTTVHCGHGPSTTIGREKRQNPFLR
jgi:hydroxyacylglutathione hydrolase